MQNKLKHPKKETKSLVSRKEMKLEKANQGKYWDFQYKVQNNSPEEIRRVVDIIVKDVEDDYGIVVKKGMLACYLDHKTKTIKRYIKKPGWSAIANKQQIKTEMIMDTLTIKNMSNGVSWIAIKCVATRSDGLQHDFIGIADTSEPGKSTISKAASMAQTRARDGALEIAVEEFQSNFESIPDGTEIRKDSFDPFVKEVLIPCPLCKEASYSRVDKKCLTCNKSLEELRKAKKQLDQIKKPLQQKKPEPVKKKEPKVVQVKKQTPIPDKVVIDQKIAEVKENNTKLKEIIEDLENVVIDTEPIENIPVDHEDISEEELFEDIAPKLYISKLIGKDYYMSFSRKRKEKWDIPYSIFQRILSSNVVEPDLSAIKQLFNEYFEDKSVSDNYVFLMKDTLDTYYEERMEGRNAIKLYSIFQEEADKVILKIIERIKEDFANNQHVEETLMVLIKTSTTFSTGQCKWVKGFLLDRRYIIQDDFKFRWNNDL